ATLIPTPTPALHVTCGSPPAGGHTTLPCHWMSPPRKRGPIARAEARRRVERIGGRGHSTGAGLVRRFGRGPWAPRLRGGDMWGARGWHVGGEGTIGPRVRGRWHGLRASLTPPGALPRATLPIKGREGALGLSGAEA